jgi:hypothetical protein
MCCLSVLSLSLSFFAVLANASLGIIGKSGQTPLVELDKYRYDTAPELFGSTVSERPMDLDAIKTLVEWKL